MSVEDFGKMIDRVQGEDDLEGRLLVTEAFVRYIAKGGVNPYHSFKIARLLMDGLAIEKKPK